MKLVGHIFTHGRSLSGPGEDSQVILLRKLWEPDGHAKEGATGNVAPAGEKEASLVRIGEFSRGEPVKRGDPVTEGGRENPGGSWSLTPVLLIANPRPSPHTHTEGSPPPCPPTIRAHRIRALRVPVCEKLELESQVTILETLTVLDGSRRRWRIWT